MTKLDSDSISHSKNNGRGAARLNLFQRLVRQWENIHPYNGVQLLKIRGAADVEGLRTAWHDAMEILGLGRVNIRGDAYSLHRLNGESAQHTVFHCPFGTTVDAWCERELNLPFSPQDGVPFRPFVVEDAGHHWIGLGYQHWIADSASIRMLLHEWFVRQYDPSAAGNRPLRLFAGGYLSLFGPHSAGWGTCDALLNSMRWQSQFRRARRVEDPETFRDMTAKFHSFAAPDGLIEHLCKSARKLGVTVNDFLLAAIAEACNRHVPVPRRYRRQDLAVASIVDLRGKIDCPLHDVFDLLLGFTSVIIRPHHLEDWNALLHSVSAQTQRQKKSGAPQASWIRMMGAWLAGRMLSRDKMLDFYRKRVSLAGANSNVNANQSWTRRYHPAVIDQYLRVAPTGPMTPLVLSTTTLGEGMTLGLTYRPAILPVSKAELFMRTFMDRLASL